MFFSVNNSGMENYTSNGTENKEIQENTVAPSLNQLTHYNDDLIQKQNGEFLNKENAAEPHAEPETAFCRDATQSNNPDDLSDLNIIKHGECNECGDADVFTLKNTSEIPENTEKPPFSHVTQDFKHEEEGGTLKKSDLNLKTSGLIYSHNIKERAIKNPHKEITDISPKHRPKVYLCLGSDKLIFDCLGPLVGSLLKGDKRFNGYVYGTMAEPVTALQVEEAIRFIRRFHFGAEVTVVDSAIGKKEEIGTVKMFDRGLRPALGVDKEMRVVGDKSIMGIITTKDKVKNLNTCNVKLNSVYSMAKRIAEIICSDCDVLQIQA